MRFESLVVSVFGFQGYIQVNVLNICPLIGGLLVTVENIIFLDSSMVEHAAVNRGVVGSSPTRGGDECLISSSVAQSEFSIIPT